MILPMDPNPFGTVCGRFCLIRASRFLEGRMHSVRPSLFDWSEQQPTRNLLRTISSLIEHQSHCGGIEHSHSGILALPWFARRREISPKRRDAPGNYLGDFLLGHNPVLLEKRVTHHATAVLEYWQFARLRDRDDCGI